LTIGGLTVSAETPYALGATNGGTFVQTNGVLFVFNSGFTNESVTLNAGATLESEFNNTWAGPIILNGDATISGFPGGGLFDLQGSISGVGNLTMTTSGSTNRISGTQANFYTGNTILLSGYFEFAKGGFDAAMQGNLQVGDPTHA